jgi:hypothetical protein
MAGTFEADLGSEITIEEGALAASTGWTLINGSINKIGPLVALHLEFSFAAGAPALALQLPDQNFWPNWDAHDTSGHFTVSAENGEITYSASTVTLNAGPVVLEIVYDPWGRG